MNYPRIRRAPLLSLATLTSLVLATDARATDPTSCGASKPAVEVWPLWERPTNPTDIQNYNKTVPSSGVWNILGEYQRGGLPGHYVHTGTDFNGTFDPNISAGDWVVVAADGYIWGVHNLNTDECMDEALCKLHIRSFDHRYVYYYAHLNLRKASDGGVEDSAVRTLIERAADYDSPDENADVDPMGMDNNAHAYVQGDSLGTGIDAGKVLTGVAPFFNGFTHLHLAIMDACQKFDALDPLDYMVWPTIFRDETAPEIVDLSLVKDGMEVAASACEVLEAPYFDVVAEMRDTWANNGKPGETRLGVARANYWLANLSSPTDPTPNEWYNFDQTTIKCAGPVKGTGCSVPMTQASFIDEVNLLQFTPGGDPMETIESGGPYMGKDFVDELYGIFGSFTSVSEDYIPPTVAIYHHFLNHQFGLKDPDPGDPGGPIKVSGAGGLESGLYQLSAEAFDQQGNGAVKSRYFIVDNDDGEFSTANLVLRDNDLDDGAIPSTMGGKSHSRSVSIRVGGVAPDKDSNAWNILSPAISLVEGVPTDVHVRVENRGCETVEAYQLKVGTTQGALVSKGWVEIGTVTGHELAPGESEVLTIEDWEPGEDEVGHRCMLAAVDSPQDPSKIPMFDFAELEGPSSKFVPFDNNLTQRNLTVSGSSGAFKLGNPFAVPVTLAVEFDCRDFPIYTSGASLRLRMGTNAAIYNEWDSVERTTMTPLTGAPQMELGIAGCKVHLPPVTLPANTEVDAWLDVTLPGSIHGTWTMDFKAIVNGQQRDGISVEHTQ
ncbi:MAG: hypothetical protein ABW004_14820 [Aeromicrobium sp.]